MVSELYLYNVTDIYCSCQSSAETRDQHSQEGASSLTRALLCISDQFLSLSFTVGSKSKCHKIKPDWFLLPHTGKHSQQGVVAAQQRAETVGINEDH